MEAPRLRVRKTKPSYKVMIHRALREQREQNLRSRKNQVMSLVALEKYISSRYPVPEGPHFQTWLKTAIREELKEGRIERVKMSYRLTTRERARLYKKSKKTNNSRRKKRQAPLPVRRRQTGSSSSSTVSRTFRPSSSASSSSSGASSSRPSSSSTATRVTPTIISAPTTKYAVVFNTTDMRDVTQAIANAIQNLLNKEQGGSSSSASSAASSSLANQLKVGLIANRGWNHDATYRLECLNFSNDATELCRFTENAHGEGSDWLMYYRQVLNTAKDSFTWGCAQKKYLILIGNRGIGVVNGDALHEPLRALVAKGVEVWAFHFTQLNLLGDLLETMH
ncbi:hypothetical protein QOT17_003015 [Balamuthia mandrillaris]